MEQEEDWSLIERALTGDDRAFTQLFERYYSFLYKYLLKLTLDEDVFTVKIRMKNLRIPISW